MNRYRGPSFDPPEPPESVLEALEAYMWGNNYRHMIVNLKGRHEYLGPPLLERLMSHLEPDLELFEAFEEALEQVAALSLKEGYAAAEEARGYEALEQEERRWQAEMLEQQVIRGYPWVEVRK